MITSLESAAIMIVVAGITLLILCGWLLGTYITDYRIVQVLEFRAFLIGAKYKQCPSYYPEKGSLNQKQARLNRWLEEAIEVTAISAERDCD